MNTATESTLLIACQNLGLSIQSSSPLFTKDAEGWENFAFQVAIVRNNKTVWSGPYHLGVGHVKLPKPWSGMMNGLFDGEDAIVNAMQQRPNVKFLPEGEAKKARMLQRLADKQKLTPKLDDVMNSLLSDDAQNESFEEWCSSLGYDTDSRKAESTWRACMETGMALRRAFNAQELETLRHAAQDF
jgi:hypothetical protein